MRTVWTTYYFAENLQYCLRMNRVHSLVLKVAKYANYPSKVQIYKFMVLTRLNGKVESALLLFSSRYNESLIGVRVRYSSNGFRCTVLFYQFLTAVPRLRLGMSICQLLVHTVLYCTLTNDKKNRELVLSACTVWV